MVIDNHGPRKTHFGLFRIWQYVESKWSTCLRIKKKLNQRAPLDENFFRLVLFLKTTYNLHKTFEVFESADRLFF